MESDFLSLKHANQMAATNGRLAIQKTKMFIQTTSQKEINYLTQKL